MRNDAIRRKLFCLIFLLGIGSIPTGWTTDGVSTSSVDKGYVVKLLRGGIYWLSDGAYNTIFVISSVGVIVIDPIPTLGDRYLQAIREVTDKPITHIVYSHEHTDHIGSAYLFPKSATIVAQQETADLLKLRLVPRRPIPTVTFERDYKLQTGGQTLVLSYRGPNHAAGNLFIYAPAQKVLMLVDVIYPGYMAYPNLGVSSDIPGYIQAHRDVLAYDFTDFVGGHVDRIGTRKDVEISMEFVLNLKSTAENLLAQNAFPTYLKTVRMDRSKTTWFAHDDYEKNLVEQCYAKLAEKWTDKLLGTERFLRSHCWSMIVGLAIQMPPATTNTKQELSQ